MLHYYEICFYGSENPEGTDYNAEKECSYAIKTEISPENMNKHTALEILFCNPDEKEKHKDLIQNCTAVLEISPEDADSFFDTESLTVRTESPYGIYYKNCICNAGVI